MGVLSRVWSDTYIYTVCVCVCALPFYQLKYNIETFIILGTDKVLFDYNMTLQYGICLIDKIDRIHPPGPMWANDNNANSAGRRYSTKVKILILFYDGIVLTPWSMSWFSFSWKLWARKKTNEMEFRFFFAGAVNMHSALSQHLNY